MQPVVNQITLLAAFIVVTHLHAETSKCLRIRAISSKVRTTAILEAIVGEPPHVPQADGVPNAREDEVQLVGPAPTFVFVTRGVLWLIAAPVRLDHVLVRLFTGGGKCYGNLVTIVTGWRGAGPVLGRAVADRRPLWRRRCWNWNFWLGGEVRRIVNAERGHTFFTFVRLNQRFVEEEK